MEGAPGRLSGLAPLALGVRARQDQRVEHRFSATGLDCLAVVGVVVRLVSVVRLHAPDNVLEHSHFLGRRRPHVHRPPQAGPCECVRDHRVTGHAYRLALTGPELLAPGGPHIHPFVQVRRSPVPIPAGGSRRRVLRSGPVGGESGEHRDDDGDGAAACAEHHDHGASVSSPRVSQYVHSRPGTRLAGVKSSPLK